MIKYICDMCSTEITAEERVKLSYRVKQPSKIAEHYINQESDSKDLCVECARKFIGSESIEKNVAVSVEKIKRREERMKAWGTRNEM